MACSISIGQTALLALPPRTGNHARMEDTEIASSLKAKPSEVKDKGMLVYKVGKVGSSRWTDLISFDAITSRSFGILIQFVLLFFL